MHAARGKLPRMERLGSFAGLYPMFDLLVSVSALRTRRFNTW